MIYCSNCGKGIPDQSKFCTFCGTAIRIADVQQPEINTPSEQQYVPPTPPPQQFINPTPAEQQYVPPTPTPIPQQYVNPAPPLAQQFAHATHTSTTGAKNEFYKNVGFWGAVITLVGFFLPYVNGYDVSFYYLVSDIAPEKPELYLYLIFPVSAAILIIQGLTGILPNFLVVIFKILPLLMLVLFAVGISKNSSEFGFMGDDIGSILSKIGIGLYMTVIGTVLMLFFRTTKTRM